MHITIEEAGVDEAPLVFEWVLRLLRELGEEADDLGALDLARVTRAWREAGAGVVTLVARRRRPADRRRQGARGTARVGAGST